MHWILLAVGIGIEILATASLKLSDEFTKLGFAALTLICFGVAFYVMSLVVRTMPLGIAHSVWAGGGIASVTLLGVLAFGQGVPPDHRRLYVRLGFRVDGSRVRTRGDPMGRRIARYSRSRTSVCHEQHCVSR
jgi:multidrug transporter EmrE-like cation transporter